MSVNNSARAAFPTELRETMIGSPILIGKLEFNPVLIIFDNQSTVPIAISTSENGAAWRTFPAGQALVLDVSAARQTIQGFSFDKGTSFYGNGASGDFSISYIYAKNV